MAHQTVTERDDDKQVINAQGETIGVGSGVRNGMAYVDRDPSVMDNIMAKLGWKDIGAAHNPLDSSRIEMVTDGETRLKQERLAESDQRGRYTWCNRE